MIRLDPQVVSGCCALLVACTGSERSGEGPWHEQPSEITVAISAAADSGVVLDTVRSLPAPEIEFTALVEPDPSHAGPATAPAAGTVAAVSPTGDVRPGDTLAVIAPRSGTAGARRPVMASLQGTWQPRREPGQLVWEGDTVGVIETHDYWWAVGSVSELESELIHPDDPAWVGTGTDRHAYRPGQVERVRRSRFSAEVAVEFRGHQQYARGTPVTAIVAPGGPHDSVPAVPASAIVHLPEGHAVFSRLRPGSYRLRWVAAGQRHDGLVGIRGDIRRGSFVATHGLVPLAEAARDSLERRSANRSAKTPP